MTSKNTATEIKRHIGGNNSDLYLAQHDGQMWATNRYWLTRGSTVSPLLEKFNVPADATGQYEVNGTVRKVRDDAPKVAPMLELAQYDKPLARARIADRWAFAADGMGNYLALFTDPDGNFKAVRADWLDWLRENSTPHAYGERYSEPRYMLNGSKVAIVADREVQHGGHIGDDHKMVPVTWENTGPELLAVLMTVKLG